MVYLQLMIKTETSLFSPVGPENKGSVRTSFRIAYNQAVLAARAETFLLEEDAFRMEAPAKRGYPIDEDQLYKIQAELGSAKVISDVLQGLGKELTYTPLPNGCALTSFVEGRALGVRVQQAQDRAGNPDLQVHYLVNGRDIRRGTTEQTLQPYFDVMSQLATGPGVAHLAR